MADPKRLLVVTQPILGLISSEDIEQAIPASRRTLGWDLLEVAPIHAALRDLHTIDWKIALDGQERLLAERFPVGAARPPRIAYLGFAPIPLALHLGYRLERTIPIDVYERHHRREDWGGLGTPSGGSRMPLKETDLPEHGSTDVGPLVIRVSISHRIDPSMTTEVVPRSLAEVDIALRDPAEDALETPELLGDVVAAFNGVLSRLNRLFPRASMIHLFTAIPVGLAFRLGTQINPTIYPPIVTYQYWAKGRPRYRAALLLAESHASANAALIGASVFSELAPSPLDEIDQLYDAALAAGLVDRRNALFAGVDEGYRTQLSVEKSPNAQVLCDLNALFKVGALADGSVPLQVWLRNAARLSRPRRECAVFEAALARRK